MNRCICNMKVLQDDENYCGFGETVLDDSVELSNATWTSIKFGIQHNGRYVIWASGDDRAEYYPKYCPECGRKLYS